MTENFNLDAEKAATIAKLEAIERVGLDIKALKDKIANLDVVKLIEDHIKSEASKIEKYATKHNIGITINTDELVAVVKLPTVPTPDTKGQKLSGTILPFTPEDGSQVTDTNWDEWRYSESEKRWIPESEWASSWEDSGC